jgi:hypothetical protein
MVRKPRDFPLPSKAQLRPIAATVGVRLPAVTIYQPWAHWIAIGWKRIEVRNSNVLASLVGRRFAIHAARFISVEYEARAVEFAADLGIRTKSELWDSIKDLTYSAVLATGYAQAHELLTAAHSNEAMIDCSVLGGIARVGTYISDVVPLPQPIAAKGQQGIWYWETEKENLA